MDIFENFQNTFKTPARPVKTEFLEELLFET